MSESSRIEKLEKELEELKNQMGRAKKEKKEKKEKKPREPSKYNEFVKDFLAKEKEKKDYDHKKAFIDASKAWQLSKT